MKKGQTKKVVDAAKEAEKPPSPYQPTPAAARFRFGSNDAAMRPYATTRRKTDCSKWGASDRSFTRGVLSLSANV
jgi:hypothetical protein